MCRPIRALPAAAHVCAFAFNFIVRRPFVFCLPGLSQPLVSLILIILKYKRMHSKLMFESHSVSMGKPIQSVASDIALAHRALYRFLLTAFINIPQDSPDLLSQVPLSCLFVVSSAFRSHGFTDPFLFVVASQFASLWFGSLTPFAREIYIGECEALLKSKVDAPETELKPVAPSKLANVSAQAFHSMFVINIMGIVFDLASVHPWQVSQTDHDAPSFCILHVLY
jgi:hypothetical protein